MRLLLRLVIVTALAGLAWVVFREYQAVNTIAPDDARYDPTKVMTLFLSLIALGIAAGVMFAFSVLPLIGEQIGAFFYAPGQESEKSPHAPALACVARGDLEGAVAAYRAVLDGHPTDTHAISEATRLLCDKLERPADAAALLEEQLQKEWGMEDLAFLVNRLVDVSWNHLRDFSRASELLQQLVEAMPETRHSANATHRLRDIQREFEALPPDQQAGAAPAAEADSPALSTPGEEELTIEFLSGPDAPAKEPPRS